MLEILHGYIFKEKIFLTILLQQKIYPGFNFLNLKKTGEN